MLINIFAFSIAIDSLETIIRKKILEVLLLHTECAY